MAGYATPSWTNNDSPPISAANLTALGEAVEIAEHPYGVCSTAAATAAKTVSIDFSGTLALFTGLTVRVKFTYANTASSPTLNVNGTGAEAIVFSGAAVGNGAWMAGEVMEFLYDGTSWNMSKSPVDSTPTASSQNLVTSGGVESAIGRVAPMSVELKKGQQAIITVSSYYCAFRAFGIATASERIDLLFSYGRKFDGITGTALSATLSADYKTVTIQNNFQGSGGTAYLGVIFCPGTDAQTISVTVEAIP